MADCVIVLWSRDSIRSAEVLDEARYGRSSGILVQAAIDDAPIPMPFLLDEPTALTDEWSVTSLVRNVGRVLREGSGAPDPEPDEEKDLATAQEELPRENLEQAEVHAEAGKLDQAIAIYERWVELKPDDMKVVRRLADMYLSADRRAEAASRYAEVAEHYARSGFSDLSLDTYQRVVELAPDKSEYGVRLEQLQTLRQNERDRPRGAMSGVMFSIAAPFYVAAGGFLFARRLGSRRKRPRQGRGRCRYARSRVGAAFFRVRCPSASLHRRPRGSVSRSKSVLAGRDGSESFRRHHEAGRRVGRPRRRRQHSFERPPARARAFLGSDRRGHSGPRDHPISAGATPPRVCVFCAGRPGAGARANESLREDIARRGSVPRGTGAQGAKRRLVSISRNGIVGRRVLFVLVSRIRSLEPGEARMALCIAAAWHRFY